MSSRWRRFEVLLPIQFNDGRDVPSEWLAEAVLEIVDHFFSPPVQFSTTAIGVCLVLRACSPGNAVRARVGVIPDGTSQENRVAAWAKTPAARLLTATGAGQRGGR